MKFLWKIKVILALSHLGSTWATQYHPEKSTRPKRSFGFSNPIFSRVFNPYDDRPLSAKFFGYDDVPQVPQYDSPQHYPLWRSPPVLEEEEEEDAPEESYGRYYPLSSMVSKPYPPSGKPHPGKPYPEAAKPYPPPSKPYPASSKPPNPCPKPNPGSQNSHGSSFGNLFVDEVRKTLRFVKDPKTGELVPRITDDISSTFDQKTTTERSEDFQKTETTTRRNYDFKLLPLYETKNKFNEHSSTPEPIKVDIKTEEKHQKALKELRDFEVRKKKIVEAFYGLDETRWPPNAFDVLLGKLENINNVENYRTTTKAPTTTRPIPVFVSSTARPFFIVQNTLVQNKFQGEAPQVHEPPSSKVTKKPCVKKTPQREFQVRYPQLLASTERPPQLNIKVRITNNTNPSPFSLRITPNNRRTQEDYTQFLAPPASIIYQRFSSVSSPSTVAPITSPTTANDNYKSYPSRALEFRVFNKKLDQETLDSFKDPQTGKYDTAKLEAATHTVFIEPVGRKFQTLESRKLNVLGEFFEESKNYDNSRHYSVSETATIENAAGDELVPFTKTFMNGLDGEKNKYLEQVLKPEGIYNIGDIPLDRNTIWDNNTGVLTDSYGRKIV